VRPAQSPYNRGKLASLAEKRLRNCDPIGLLEIARLTEYLDILRNTAAAFCYGDDVVEVQLLLRSAAHAVTAVARPNQ
jgi:hypothetical protein